MFNKLSNAKRIFLIDGLGAFLTAFLIFAFLRPINESFGMPKTTLTILSIIAFVFSVYSIACFLFVHENWIPFLQAISVANLLYCFLTLGLVVYYYYQQTIIGLSYFLLEIVVIIGIVSCEISVLTKNSRKKLSRDN